MLVELQYDVFCIHFKFVMIGNSIVAIIFSA